MTYQGGRGGGRGHGRGGGFGGHGRGPGRSGGRGRTSNNRRDASNNNRNSNREKKYEFVLQWETPLTIVMMMNPPRHHLQGSVDVVLKLLSVVSALESMERKVSNPSL